MGDLRVADIWNLILRINITSTVILQGWEHALVLLFTVALVVDDDVWIIEFFIDFFFLVYVAVFEDNWLGENTLGWWLRDYQPTHVTCCLECVRFVLRHQDLEAAGSVCLYAGCILAAVFITTHHGSETDLPLSHHAWIDDWIVDDVNTVHEKRFILFTRY